MDINTIWNKVLEIIEKQLAPVSYEIWFMDTKLVELHDEFAKVLVQSDIYKKHLKEMYNPLIEQCVSEVTGSNFKIEYVTEEEFKKNIVVDTDGIGVPSSLYFENNLDQRFSFENFVTGSTNKFSKAIALSVAEQPGLMYNPLFIYGSSGLGKTHLMHAIGNYIIKNSNKKVLYVTSEKFVEDFLNIYRKSKSDDNFDAIDFFKKKYRNLDVLMIDDIQYLEIAAKTQQEFFNTFNELHRNNKQIIISSDRSPDDLKKLEERLRTRFSWGITIDIMPPDFELRLAIIDKKIENQSMNLVFPDKVKEYIATNCNSDVRKLEGAITRVLAYATIMNGSDITYDLTVEALKDYFVKGIISKNKIDQVQQLVCQKFNLSLEDLKGKKRSASISFPRQIAMYICRIYINESLPKIGSEFGGKDHTTVMHSVDKIKKELISNKDIEEIITEIVNQIK